MTVIGYICRATGKVCEYATEMGFCKMTECIKTNYVAVTTVAWTKSREK